MIHIRFWWPGYSPEDALDSFDPAVQETPFEVSCDAGKSWRRSRKDATLQTIYDWMIDHDQTVVETKLGDERRNGRWVGQYVLSINRVDERK